MWVRRLLPVVAIAIVVLVISLNRDEPGPPPAAPPPAPRPASEPPTEPGPLPALEPLPEDRDGEVAKEEWVIRGTAYGPDGSPLVDSLHVKFRAPGRSRPSASVYTDASSEFRLVVSGEGSLVVACSTCSHPPVRIEDLAPPDSGELDLEVRFTEALSISGELIDQDGVTPVAGRVTLSTMDPEPWFGEHPGGARAGEDGRFEIGGLCPGRYQVHARPGDKLAGRPPDPTPEVEAGGPPVRIVLRPVTCLRVKIECTEEAPATDGMCVLTLEGEDGTRTTTSWMGRPEGEKEYFVPPGQTVRVTVSSNGYRQVGGHRVEIPPGAREAEVEVRLAAETGLGATLVLRPVDSLGRAVEALSVFREVSPGVLTGKNFTAEGGLVEVPLGPGKHVLTLRAPRDEMPVDLKPSLMARELAVELGPGERKVVDVEMTVGGWIRLNGYTGKWDELYAAPKGEELIRAPTRSARVGEGRYLHKGAPVEPGLWVLEWRREGESPVRKEVEVRPGVVSEVDF